MYTLEQLQSKALTELKEIGYELNVIPAGDRRRRQSWIEAIAGKPPLLQLLEVSPVEDVQAQESPVIETVETPPGQDIINETWTSWEKEYSGWLKGAEWCVYKGENKRILAFLPVSKTLRLEGMEQGANYCAIWEVSECSFDFAGRPLPVSSSLYQESITEAAKTSPGAEVDQAQERDSKFDCPECKAIESLHLSRDCCLEMWVINCLHCSYSRPMNPSGTYLSLPDPALDLFGVFPFKADLLRRQKAREAIVSVTETSPGVENDVVPDCAECFDDGFLENEWGSIVPCRCSETKLSRQKTQSAIAPAAKNLPSRSKTSTAHQLLELFKSSAHIIDSPAGETEQVSQSAIEQAAKNQESDLNPIVTRLSLSDKFLARYSPPQAEVFQFQADADGQLSLIDFEVQSQPEPPDPDDFESLDDFRKAIAQWDAQNPEPPAVSIDSMCEWAMCPPEWYEPEAELLPLIPSSMSELLEPSSVSELSLAPQSSSTSDFSIPTFGAWCDRQNGTDEPPDTGLFAKLPKPKPPGFPPQATWTQLGHNLDTGQPKSGQVRTSQPETIPKLFHCGDAGSSTQPARSPPGGDAVF